MTAVAAPVTQERRRVPRLALPVAILALIACVALAIIALLYRNELDSAKRAASSANAANATLAKRVSALEHAPKVDAPTKQELATDLAVVAKRDTKMATRVQTLENCLPEIQTELDSLTLNNDGFISIDQQVSRACTKVLYGTTGSGD